MPEANLTAEIRRETGKRPAGRFRREGRVPAVVYGLGTDTQSVTVPARELQHILTGGAGSNTLITLRVEGSDQLALAREIQRDPLKGSVLHVDFIRVRADQTVTADVPLHLTGEAEGVSLGGILEQALFTLTIEALPGDIPNAIEADISALNMGDQLRVSELTMPSGVVTSLDGEELVAQVVAPRVAEEPVTGVPAEEGAEGEAPAAEGAAEGDSGE
ncbi:MAG: large subunit ribosomal protein [Actinomycetota bacterium]|jgi:large subunit ribosomal protein L25|nr:large subunit ribosomal protein [Actinomycetota bacterium]